MKRGSLLHTHTHTNCNTLCLAVVSVPRALTSLLSVFSRSKVRPRCITHHNYACVLTTLFALAGVAGDVIILEEVRCHPLLLPLDHTDAVLVSFTGRLLRPWYVLLPSNTLPFQILFLLGTLLWRELGQHLLALLCFGGHHFDTSFFT